MRYDLGPLVIDNRLPVAATANGNRCCAARLAVHRFFGIGYMVTPPGCAVHDKLVGYQHKARCKQVHAKIGA